MKQLLIVSCIIILLSSDSFAAMPRAKPVMMIPELKPKIIILQTSVDDVPAEEKNVPEEIKLLFANDNIQVATFTRNGWLWFVINQASNSNAEQSLSGKLYQQYEVISNKQQFIFRIKSEQFLSPLIQQHNNTLTINLLDSSITQRVQPTVRASHVALTLPNNSQEYIEIIDPDLQDKLIVVLTDLEQRVLDREYRWPHFHLLRSYYGVAINARAENIQTIVDGEALHIYHPLIQWSEVSHNIDVTEPIFQFRNWYDECADFNRIKIEIQNAVFENASLENRLKLVKFFIAHQMLQEALSYLNYIRDVEKDCHDSISFKLLYIAALYLTQNYSEAASVMDKLSNKGLNHQQMQEVKFWRDAITIQLTGQHIPLELDSLFLQQYGSYKTDFMLLAFQQAVANTDHDRVKNIEKRLRNNTLSDFQHNQFMLLMADIMIETKEDHEALSIYDNLIANNKDIYHKALATVHKTKYLYEKSIIDIEQSIHNLEKLKILIRGEKIEPELFELLSKLYLDNQQYAESLFILKEIHTRFGHYDNIIPTHKRIYQLLLDLFNTNVIYEMTPLVALDIFINFKDFLPIGEDGMLISLKFTDYLININLIPEAIKFLQHLIQYRLQGEVKDENIIKLAKLHLQENQFEHAIFLLHKHKLRSSEAIHIQSRSFLHLQKYHAAYSLLENDHSAKADHIRCEILWQSHDWFGLIKHLAPLVQQYANTAQELSNMQQQQIFYLATAYFQQNDLQNLSTLLTGFADQSIEKKDTIILLQKVVEGDTNNLKALLSQDI